MTDQLIVQQAHPDGSISLWHHCPACKEAHRVVTGPGNGPRWTYNGNPESPTFSPSVRNKWGDEVCHYFVADGKIQYCNDCTHSMAGQRVDLLTFQPGHYIFRLESHHAG